VVTIADIVYVTRADTGLHVTKIGVRRLGLAREVSFQRGHPRVDEKERRVIGGEQRSPFNPKVIALLEKLKESFADLLAGNFLFHAGQFPRVSGGGARSLS
jgi:hypothetical protein